MDSNFPKKVDKEDNKISVDIINDDQALAAAFEKMTDEEYNDKNFMVGDDSELGTLIGKQQEDGQYSFKNSIGEAFDILDQDDQAVENNQTERLTKNLKKEAAKAISKTKKAVESDLPTKKIWSNSEISKMNRRTFEKFEAEIDEASREGRIQP